LINYSYFIFSSLSVILESSQEPTYPNTTSRNTSNINSNPTTAQSSSKSTTTSSELPTNHNISESGGNSSSTATSNNTNSQSSSSPLPGHSFESITHSVEASFEHAMTILDSFIHSTDNYLHSVYENINSVATEANSNDNNNNSTGTGNPSAAASSAQSNSGTQNNRNNSSTSSTSTATNAAQPPSTQEKLILSREIIDSLNIPELKMILESNSMNTTGCVDRLDHIHLLERCPAVEIIE
jgi:hypothetical protein